MRSLSQARSCEEFWIRLTYLFLADFTYSYRALKCSNLFPVYSYFLVKSKMSNSFTFSSYLVSRTSAVAVEAFLAMDSLTPVESLISFWILLTILFKSVRLPSIFLISASISFFLLQLLAVLSLMVAVRSTTMTVSYLIYSSLAFCSRISEVMIENSFLIFQMIISVSLMISCCCPRRTSCFLYSLLTFWVYLRVLLILQAQDLMFRESSSIPASWFMTSTFNCPLSDSLLLIIFLIDSIAVPISSVFWKDSSRSPLNCSICSFCCSIFSLKVTQIFSFRSISSRRSFSSACMPIISMFRFQALLAQWSGESLIFSLTSFNFYSYSASSEFSFLMACIFCIFSSRILCKFSIEFLVFSFMALFSWISRLYFSKRGWIFSSAVRKSSRIFWSILATSLSSSSAQKSKFSQEAFCDSQATSAVLSARDNFSVSSVTSAWRLLAASYSCLMAVRSFLRIRMVSFRELQFFWESLMILKSDLMTPETQLNCSQVSLPCLQKYWTDSVPYFMFMAIRFYSFDIVQLIIQMMDGIGDILGKDLKVGMRGKDGRDGKIVCTGY